MDWKFLAQFLDLGRHPMDLNSYYPTNDKKHSTLSLHFTNGLSFPLKKIILIGALRPGIYYGCCIAGRIALCTNITVSIICTVSMKNFQQITVMNCGLFLGGIQLLIVKKLTWSYSLPFYVQIHLETEFYYMCFHPGIILNYLCARTTPGSFWLSGHPRVGFGSSFVNPPGATVMSVSKSWSHQCRRAMDYYKAQQVPRSHSWISISESCAWFREMRI